MADDASGYTLMDHLKNVFNAVDGLAMYYLSQDLLKW